MIFLSSLLKLLSFENLYMAFKSGNAFKEKAKNHTIPYIYKSIFEIISSFSLSLKKNNKINNF